MRKGEIMKISICEKCKHFTQHYIHSKMLGFSDVKCGHCHKKLMKKKVCGCFEKGNETKEKEITAMHYLHNYNKQLNDLSCKLGNLINSIKSLENEVKNL